MKKFFYVALMAIAVAFTSCGLGVGNGSSEQYKNGKEPEIDLNNNSVNGIVYDNETEHCYKFTVKTTTLGISASADSYTWGTEFEVVFACEESMYIVAQTGISKASYKYVIVPGADEDKCDELASNAN